MARTARRKRKTQIGGQFAWRLVEMLESPAYRALSLSAHRVLARLEIELAAHGGDDNGRLPCTFDHFAEYGIHRHAIAPAIREVEALGFVEVTEAGRAGNAAWRRPTLFRLTYRHTAKADPTDEWRKVDVDQAKEKKHQCRKPHHRSVRKPHHKGQSCSAETITTVCSAETITTSIYRDIRHKHNGSAASARPPKGQARDAAGRGAEVRALMREAGASAQIISLPTLTQVSPGHDGEARTIHALGGWCKALNLSPDCFQNLSERAARENLSAAQIRMEAAKLQANETAALAAMRKEHSHAAAE